jgi:hypothetical protein
LPPGQRRSSAAEILERGDELFDAAAVCEGRSTAIAIRNVGRSHRCCSGCTRADRSDDDLPLRFAQIASRVVLPVT